jgi:3-dehydroquinate synthase
MPKTIIQTENSINGGRNYPIEIGSLSELSLESILNLPENKNAKLFILLDEHSLQNCFPKLVNDCPSFSRAEVLEIESSEASKNIEICTRIWQAITELGADRESILVNLGGGVITDMGGFIAGVYKRGIRFINIPTTLLAMVDASIGGKTGVDLDNVKNQLGIFNSPEAIYIDTDFLKTLSKRQMMAGLAEMIKHALIADRSYWDLIRKSDFSENKNWTKLILPSLKIKNEIVKNDPSEKGLRKILNFGHTVGHAIESFALENANILLLHGEAVAIGMICESYLSFKHHLITKKDLEEITEFITSIYPRFPLEELAHHRIIELMKNDKKNKNNQINFTLLNSIGTATFDNFIPAGEIKSALVYYKAVYEK